MKKLFLLIGLMIAGNQFLNAQTEVPANNPNAPEITFAKVEHDYGTVVKGGDGNCEFEFTNTGKEPLVLSNVRSSCGCTVPQWTREPILPGKKGTIAVKYDTNRLGAINKQITVLSNAKSSTVVLKIKGNVVDAPAQGVPEKQPTTPQSK